MPSLEHTRAVWEWLTAHGPYVKWPNYGWLDDILILMDLGYISVDLDGHILVLVPLWSVKEETNAA